MDSGFKVTLRSLASLPQPLVSELSLPAGRAWLTSFSSLCPSRYYPLVSVYNRNFPRWLFYLRLFKGHLKKLPMAGRHFPEAGNLAPTHLSSYLYHFALHSFWTRRVGLPASPGSPALSLTMVLVALPGTYSRCSVNPSQAISDLSSSSEGAGLLPRTDLPPASLPLRGSLAECLSFSLCCFLKPQTLFHLLVLDG